MPVFEFKCNSCGGRFAVLMGVISVSDGLSCPTCGGDDLTKLISRFATAKSADGGLDDMADPEDPSSIKQLVREMKSELGEDVGDDFEEMLDAATSEDCE